MCQSCEQVCNNSRYELNVYIFHIQIQDVFIIIVSKFCGSVVYIIVVCVCLHACVNTFRPRGVYGVYILRGLSSRQSGRSIYTPRFP
jgi:hypothetical protein